jgi:hypothetical protein
MKSCAIALICLLLLATAGSLCQADSKVVQREQVTVFVEDVMYNILGSKTFSYEATSLAGANQLGPLNLSFTLGLDSQPGKTMFTGIPLTSEVGKTVWTNAACSTPSYSAFVVALTDGRNDRLSATFTLESLLGTVSSTTTHFYESALVPNGGANDFKGNRIGRIGIRIDHASVEEIPGAIDVVPEPVSASVLLAGLGCMALIRKRRRK